MNQAELDSLAHIFCPEQNLAINPRFEVPVSLLSIPPVPLPLTVMANGDTSIVYDHVLEGQASLRVGVGDTVCVAAFAVTAGQWVSMAIDAGLALSASGRATIQFFNSLGALLTQAHTPYYQGASTQTLSLSLQAPPFAVWAACLVDCQGAGAPPGVPTVATVSALPQPINGLGTESSSFEGGTVGVWTSDPSPQACTLQNVSGLAYVGTHSMGLLKSGSPGEMTAHSSSVATPVGQVWSASAFFRAISGGYGPMGVGLRWLNSSAVTLYTDIVTGNEVSPGTPGHDAGLAAWAPVALTRTAPAGCTQVQVVLYLPGIRPVGEEHLADNIWLYAVGPPSGSSTAPKVGDQYYVTATARVYAWNGTAWVDSGAGHSSVTFDRAIVSTTPAPLPFFDGDSGACYWTGARYYSPSARLGIAGELEFMIEACAPVWSSDSPTVMALCR